MHRWLIVLMYVLAGGGGPADRLWAESPATVLPPELEPVRLSAIVNSGSRYLAGFVDAKTGVAYLIPVGGKMFNWRITAIDEKAMSALLVSPEGRELRLDLTGDVDAAPEGDAALPDEHIKTMAEFIAEHPELVQAPADVVPLPTLSTNTTSYEAFMASHPEMAGLTNSVAPEVPSHSNPPAPAELPMLDLPEHPPVEVP